VEGEPQPELIGMGSFTAGLMYNFLHAAYRGGRRQEVVEEIQKINRGDGNLKGLIAKNKNKSNKT